MPIHDYVVMALSRSIVALSVSFKISSQWHFCDKTLSNNFCRWVCSS